MSEVAIVGVGTTRFGKFIDIPLPALASEAIDEALADAGLGIEDIEMAFVANAVASITTGQVSVVGQSVLRPLGFAGIPVFNVDNACAGSSSSVSLAVQALRSGAATTVLVVGVEKMYSADRATSYRALNGAADIAFLDSTGADPGAGSIFVAHIYPKRLDEYRSRYGLDARALATISVKNRRHAGLNSDAQYTSPLTVEDVLSSKVVVEPVTALMCAPISDGASAMILTTDDALRDGQRPVWVASSAVGMGAPQSGQSSIARVAARAYSQAGIGPEQIDIAELHDSISFNELVASEELGLCEQGTGARFALDGHSSLGGLLPINPSGGLESRGHPMAATGGAQLAELTRQLRGEAGERQVPDARYGIAENAGGFAVDDTASIAITILAAERPN